MPCSYQTIERNGATEHVLIEYRIYAAVRGRRDGPCGPQLTPDEPAEVEIEQAVDVSGHVVPLTDDQEADLIGRIEREEGLR